MKYSRAKVPTSAILGFHVINKTTNSYDHLHAPVQQPFPPKRVLHDLLAGGETFGRLPSRQVHHFRRSRLGQSVARKGSSLNKMQRVQAWNYARVRAVRDDHRRLQRYGQALWTGLALAIYGVRGCHTTIGAVYAQRNAYADTRFIYTSEATNAAIPCGSCNICLPTIYDHDSNKDNILDLCLRASSPNSGNNEPLGTSVRYLQETPSRA